MTALVLSGSVAAQGFPQLRGSISAEYSRNIASGGGNDANLWSGTGDIVAGLGATRLHVQGNAGYGYFDSSVGSNIKTWNLAGSWFWHADQSVFGATLGYVNASSGARPLIM